MPIAGKITDWPAMEFGLVSDVSCSLSGSTASASSEARLVTGATPNQLVVNAGVFLSIDAGTSTGNYQLFYDGPNAPFGGWSQSGSVGAGGWLLSISAIFRGVKLYALDPSVAATWRMLVDDIEIWTNGSLQVSLGGATFNGTGLGPSWIPVCGVPADVFGNALAGAGGVPGDYNHVASMTHVVRGGWRFDDGTGWQDLPVTLPTITEPIIGTAPFGLSTSGIVVADRTWGDLLSLDSSAASLRAGCPIPPGTAAAPASLEGESSNGRVMLVPDLSREVKRVIPDDYAAMWLRFGFPKTEARSQRVWELGPNTPPKPGGNEQVIEEVHPSFTQMLSVVRAAPHVIEDPWSTPVYAPMVATRAKAFASSPATACNDDPAYTANDAESVAVYFPHTVQNLSQNPQMLGYIHHLEPLVRYVNYIASPFWSLAYGRFDWLIDGAPAPYEDYHRLVRMQHLTSDFLPEEEDPQTKNHMISCPLEESGHTPFLDTFFKAGTGRLRDGLDWIGVSRFQVRESVLPEEIVFDERSDTLYGVGENCTIDVGPTGIELTPDPDATTIAFELNVADFDHYPYLLAAFADRIEARWTTTNVAEARWYTVGRDGERQLIELVPGDGFTTEGEDYRLPIGPQAKYAGDWAQDHGALYISDQGADLQPTGISTFIMGDPERATVFSLLTGRTPRFIRCEFDIIDDADPVLLPHITLLTSPEVPELVWNTAAHAAWLYADGPGPRWSNLDWHDPVSGTIFHPDVLPLGYKSTIIDALRTMRMMAEGLFYNDGEAAELVARFDSQEGQSVGAIDRGTIAFPLPPVSPRTLPVALVNTLAEVPPVPTFPAKTRNLSTFGYTGTYGMEVLSWVQEPRRYIASGSKLDLHDPSGTKVTADALAPAGWFLTEHSEPVDGSEGLTWRLKTGARSWASGRPWHGFYAQLEEIAAEVGAGVHLCRIALGQVCAVFVRETQVTSWVFDAKGASYEAVVYDGEGVTDAQVAAHPDGTLKVALCLDGTVQEHFSGDHGRSWGEPDVLMGGAAVAIATHPSMGYEVTVVWASGDFRAYRRMHKAASYEDLGVITASDEVRGGLEFAGDAHETLVFVIDGVRRFESTDLGETWVEVS
jgi:hypothetical protein